MLIRCRLIIWFHNHLPFMIIYCPTVSVTWRMLKPSENGSNICMRQVRFWEKPRKPKFRVWPFGFGSVRVFRRRTEIRFPYIPTVAENRQATSRLQADCLETGIMLHIKYETSFNFSVMSGVAGGFESWLWYYHVTCRGLGLLGLALDLVDWPTIVLQCLTLLVGSSDP